MKPRVDSNTGNDRDFEYPSRPHAIPSWAEEAGLPWLGLRNREIELLAEERTGRKLEIRREELPSSLWGLHIARGRRVRIIINRNLPPNWERFALFHELFHVLEHRRGEHFWNRTATPMTSFETQADLFAWAVITRENAREETP